MKAKDILFSIVTQNSIFERRACFGMLHLSRVKELFECHIIEIISVVPDESTPPELF